ncbi:MAG: Verru_Chthon cassette protein D [Verrucomicrobiota bacterium]
MNASPLNRFLFRPTSGFTLLEILVVIGIAAIILSLTIPGINSIGSSTKLSNAASLVTDHLNGARAQSLAQNRHIEVRMYELSGLTGGGVYFRALQSFILDDLGTNPPEALTKIDHLPEPIVFSSNSTFSSLTDTSTTIESGTVNVNRYGLLDYCAFRFKPDGSTDLNPEGPAPGSGSSAWTITLIEEKHTANSALPPNYATIFIIPENGKIRIVRP